MQQLAALVSAGVPVDYQIVEAGFVHCAIVAEVEATRADMLVLGTHGRSGFQRVFLGSVAEKVIRSATCPTLIVPPRAWDAPAHFHRILCPIDFSDSSLRALEFAINLSEEADAKLTLLHVVDIPPAYSQEPFFLDGELVRARDAAAGAAGQQLNSLIHEKARTVRMVDTAVVEGRAYQQILQQAAEGKADLITMGVHGRGTLDLLLFGSTTHHVIRASLCPVLIVPAGMTP
jgi:nucleotide-binding universal stress UspA family protein